MTNHIIRALWVVAVSGVCSLAGAQPALQTGPVQGRWALPPSRLEPAALPAAARGELSQFTAIQRRLAQRVNEARQVGQGVHVNCVERYHQLVQSAFDQIERLVQWMEHQRATSLKEGPIGRSSVGIAERYVRVQLIKGEIVTLIAEAEGCNTLFSSAANGKTIEASRLPSPEQDPRTPINPPTERPPLASPFTAP